MHKVEAPREEWPALMILAQGGDQHAYTRLLSALVPVIRSIVRRTISDDALVDDVIQDVLLTVHRVRHTFNPSYPFLPWLMTITQARTIDALRRRGRYRRWQFQDNDVPARMADPLLSSSMALDESHEELSAFLNQLPIRQRQIVEHVHLQEMSLTEAAKQNNLTVAAVKSLLHRALNNLRRLGAHHGRS